MAPDVHARSAVGLNENRELVLVAEDDDAVRAFVSAYLRLSGFNVVDVPNGWAALSWASEHTGRIDLLVTDYSMPLLDGVQLAKEMASVHPETRVLFMTGYWYELSVPPEQVLHKPFVATELLNRVRTTLSKD